MSTPLERLQLQARQSGIAAAKRAQETESSLFEQVRYVIEHEAEGPDPSLVDTEVMACDYVIFAIEHLYREALFDPEVAHDIADEMFLHGHEGDLREVDTVPPIAIGAVMGRLFGECSTCAEGEVRQRLRADGAAAGDES